MRLWTLQPASVLDEIKETGSFKCNKELSFNLSKKDSLADKYQWLIERMELKIGPRPVGVEYPIWAWHTWEGERQCPDVNSAAFLKRTEEKVLLTLEIPDEEVVLTDFDAWQVVLNGGFLSNETDEEKLELIMEQLEDLEDEALDTFIEESWEHVFEIARIQRDDIQRGYFVQATFWEIKKDYIVDQIIVV